MKSTQRPLAQQPGGRDSTGAPAAAPDIGSNRKRGRPRTRLRAAVIREIIDRLSAGESLRLILPDDGRPAHLPPRAVFTRAVIADTPTGIALQYARARSAQALEWAEEVLALSDAPVADMVALGHARLQVDSRKWLLSKLLSKTYADKLDTTRDLEPPPFPVLILPELDPRWDHYRAGSRPAREGDASSGAGKV